MSKIDKSYLNSLSQTELFQQIATICEAVNTVVSAQELLDVSLRETLIVFRAQRGSIFITDKNKKDELVLVVSTGLQKEEQKAIVRRIGEGVIGKVAQLKQPIIVDDISSDERFKDTQPKGSYDTASFICAPLMVKDTLVGIINITDKDSGQKFNENEMQLLDFIATQIALNYRRIELYTKFKSTLQESKDLKHQLGKTNKQTQSLKRQIQIQEKLATIGKLAGGIAHEFNNPLDGVMRYTNLCLEQNQDDDVLRGYLLEVKQGLNRMATIVRNLLACSRSDVLSCEKIGFTQALDHALFSVQSELSHKSIIVKKEIEADLPEILDLGLERILTNLICNGIDAIEDEGIIIIKAFIKNDVFIFSVKDSGVGVGDVDLDQIIEPFYTTKDIDKGCGLGLTIISEIIKSYDGKINVESKEGEGAIFTVSLPLERANHG